LYRRDLSSLFQIGPAPGTFGKDYGPDLAVWRAARRFEPFRFEPLPAAAPQAGAISSSGANQGAGYRPDLAIAVALTARRTRLMSGSPIWHSGILSAKALTAQF